MLCYIIMKIIAFLKNNLEMILIVIVLILVALLFKRIVLVREGAEGDEASVKKITEDILFATSYFAS